MRAWLLIAAFLLPILMATQANANMANDIERIDLNLKEHELAVSFLGLSKGEATLIQAPDGENILVNIGENLAEVSDWLELYKVKEIQKLVLTSNVFSNVENLKEIISKYNVKELIAQQNGARLLSESLDTFPEIVVKSWNEGMKEQLLTDLLAEVQFAGSNEGEGLDFTLQFYKHRLFFMTSVSDQAEKMLLRKNLENIHIFKVPLVTHHSSISDRLIQHVNPQIAVLFTTTENESHPDFGIIDELQNNWSEIYYTKMHGTVTIKFTEASYEVFTIPSKTDEKS